MRPDDLKPLLAMLLIAKHEADKLNPPMGQQFSHRTQIQQQLTSLIGFVDGWKGNLELAEERKASA